MYRTKFYIVNNIIGRIENYIIKNSLAYYQLLEISYSDNTKTFYGDNKETATQTMSRIMNYTIYKNKPLMSATVAEYIAKNMKLKPRELIWCKDDQIEFYARNFYFALFVDIILENESTLSKAALDTLCDSARFSNYFESHYENENKFIESLKTARITDEIYSEVIIATVRLFELNKYTLTKLLKEHFIEYKKDDMNGIGCRDLQHLDSRLTKFAKIVIENIIIDPELSLGYIVRNHYRYDMKKFRTLLIDMSESEYILNAFSEPTIEYHMYNVLINDGYEFVQDIVKAEQKYISKIIEIQDEGKQQVFYGMMIDVLDEYNKLEESQSIKSNN